MSTALIDPIPLPRRLFAEGLGTAVLVCAIVGSGVMASRLSPDDIGLQLLEHALATAAVLFAVIVIMGPVSGAHLNPVVTLVDRALGRRSNRDACWYIVAQCGGGIVGAMIANVMFALPVVELSTQSRSGAGLWLGEVVATFGLILVIFGLTRAGEHRLVPATVAIYIFGAIWFTSSASFANPAVTIARAVSDSFTGIAPASVPAFVVAEIIGAVLGLAAVLALYPRSRAEHRQQRRRVDDR